MKKQMIFFLLLIIINITNANAQSIFISGSSTVKHFIDKAVDAYQIKHPDMYFSVEGGGSSIGLAEILAKKVDIAMLSRDLSMDETTQIQEFETLLLAYDTVVPVVSHAVFHSGVTSLSKKQLAQIYQGEITNWRQLGGGDKSILVVSLDSKHGTHGIFSNYIFEKPNILFNNIGVQLSTSRDVANLIRASDQAIAYISAAYTDEIIHSISITQDGRLVQPIIQNISDGQYPLSRKLRLIQTKNAPTHIQHFIQFLLSQEGQKIAEESGYIKAY